MSDENKEPVYEKPASQLDLEARLEKDNKSDAVIWTSSEAEEQEAPQDGRDYRVEDNEVEDYLGVSPEYMTYANETEKPGFSEESAEDKVAQSFFDQLITTPVVTESHSDGTPKASAESDESGDEVEDEEEEEQTPSTSPTPSTANPGSGSSQS